MFRLWRRIKFRNALEVAIAIRHAIPGATPEDFQVALALLRGEIKLDKKAGVWYHT